MKPIHIVSAAIAGALLLAISASAQTQSRTLPPDVRANVERLRAAGTASDNSYAIVEDLTTMVGPRLAGSPAEERARQWAVAMMRRQGFTNVHIEPFTMQHWSRARESAEVVSPAPQRLIIGALAGSPSTPQSGITAPVVRFSSIAELNAAPRASVVGRIVFIDEGMDRARDGSGYGRAVQRRGQCAQRAQAQGAVACLIRAVGTDHERVVHVGGNARQPQGVSLPAAALTPPDADQLARLVARGETRVHIEIETLMRDNAPSGNVVGEIRGRSHPNEIIVIGAHLDSWDLGTGANDDGAGVSIVSGAAALIRRLPRAPRRTIRVVLYGSEEIGSPGGPAYLNAHRDELRNHMLAMEADFGSGSVWRVRTRFGQQAMWFAPLIQQSLAPLNIAAGDNEASGGSDIGPLRREGVPGIDLSQDGTYYFDTHHTPNDTLNRIDREGLRQATTAFAIAAYLVADSDIDLWEHTDHPPAR